MHDVNQLSILDLGTPVALLRTLSEDGTLYLAAVTSVWWIGARCVLGLPGAAKTSANLRRTREIVINMPASEQADAVDRLVRVAGRAPVPGSKLDRGYRCVKDQIGILGLTSVLSETVRPTRVLECPIQLEAVLDRVHAQGRDSPLSGDIEMFEVRVTYLHLDGSILMDGHPDRIDPERWRPLMSRLG
jgi:flavin reductase (DIM6/NTAB) family NADH-FMN oxidoreductase RutF